MNELIFLSRVKAAQELWKFVLPDILFPPNETWVRWLAASYDSEFEKAVLQIPKRYKNQKPSDEEVYRCVSAVLAEYRRVRQRTAKIEQQKLVPTQSRVVSQKGGSMTEMNDQIAPIADPTDLSAIGEQDEQQ